MKNKKIMIIALCALVSGISIFGTYALLTAFTAPITNKFSSTTAKNLSIVLTEDKFNEAIASAYVPGDVIAKNPTIQNTSKEESVYAAIKVTYQIIEDGVTKNLKKGDFDKLAIIGTIGEGWEKIAIDEDGAELYLYKNEVKAGATIKPELFQNVTVNKKVEFKEDGTLPKFNIKVEGLATQYKNISLEDAKIALIALSKQAK